jgi:5'-deoxynucleotidase YfbR-like HD superfamily hydrolase
MPLFSGKRFWPEDPRPEDFDITDIAHALSNINRFNGHTKQAYNVAQHSVLVSRIVPAQYALHGLFHDASEALIQDFISPLKHLAMDWYGPLETKVMKAVCKKFDIDWNNDAAWIAVKKADNIMLATEVRDLTTCGFVTQRLTELPTEEHIRLCWSPECSEEMFRDRYREIILGTPKC